MAGPFADVKYYVSGILDDKVLKLLEKGGATRRKFLVEFVTHVIAGKDCDETEIAEAQDLYDLPTVDERWVWASSKLGRLANTKAYDPLPNKLFSHLTFAMAEGLTSNDYKALYGAIRFHGGAIDKHYTEKTNVLICASATGAAYAKAVAVGSERTRVVTPNWVLDCIQEKRQVDAQNYHPRLLIVSSMVIERKIIQVGLVPTTGSETESPPKGDIGDKAKQIKSVTSVSGIGAVIRPVKVTPATTSAAAPSPAKPTMVIQQQQHAVKSTTQVPQRPTTVSAATTPPSSTAVVTTITRQEATAAVAAKEGNAAEPPQVPSVGQPVAASPAAATLTNATNSTTVTGSQQVKPPQPSAAQQQTNVEATEPPKTATATAITTPVAASSASTLIPSTTLTTIPKPQIVNTKIQFIQHTGGTPNLNNANVLQGAATNTATKQTMIVQTSAATGQVLNQQTVVSGGSGQFQSTAGGQNILIIQQQLQQQKPPQDPKVAPQQQNAQQSQSEPQSPVQTPQFSNVQFIRSNSQPVGGTAATTMTTIQQAPATPQQQQQQQVSQPIQMQQLNFQMHQQVKQHIMTPQGTAQVPGAVGQGQILTIQSQQQQQQGTVLQSHAPHPGTQMIISQQGPGGVQQWTTAPAGGTQAQSTVVQQQQQQQIVAVGGPQIQQQQQQQPQGQQQFIRAIAGGAQVRGPGPQQQQQQWLASGGGPGQPQQVMPQRQLIHVDQQTHAQWAMMEPAKKAEYLAKLQSRRNIMVQRQPVQFQGRPPGPGQAPTGVVTTTRMVAGGGGQQNVVFRGPWVPQQQQQQQRQILVRSNAPGLSPIQQVVTAGGQQTVVNVVPGGSGQQVMQQGQGQVMVATGTSGGQMVGQPQQQQQQAIVQLQMDPNAPRPPFQRMASLPGGQKIIQQQQTIQTRYVIDGNPLNAEQVQQMVQQGGGVATVVDAANQPQIISKTKTALANMLNSRMTGNNGAGVVAGQPMPVVDVVEPSAAGTLRLMTAHHNATLNQSMAGPRTPQELLVLQQQQHQQRRTLGNITNAAGASVGGVVGAVGGPQMLAGGPVIPTPAGPVHMALAQQQGAGVVMKGAPPYSPGRAPQPRPQFYGHNPNLPKLPPELFLLGCNFFIVEYEESHPSELVVWRELIRKHGGEIEPFYCPRVTHVLCRSQRHGVVMQAIRDSKRCVTAHWLNDAMVKKQLLPPWQALHLPAPSTFGRQRPATRHIVSISGFEGEERQRIKVMVEETGARLTTYFSKQNTVLVCKRLDGQKYRRAKDWGVPVVNATWLSDILMGNLSTMSNFDTAKYQQYNLNCPFRIEYGLVPHLMTSWKAPINLNQESHERLKRCHSEPIPGPVAKRVAVPPPPPLEVIPETINVTRVAAPAEGNAMRVMFSQVENVEGLTRAVTAFGGTVVTDAAEATHLVMSKLVRTSKLLQCLCTVNYVLSSDWLVDSVSAGELLPESKYPLQDAEFAKMFNCDVQQVVKSSNRSKLFEGKTFHVTPSVKPSVKVLTKIIQLSGGQVEKARRSLIKIHEANAQSPKSYVVLSCPGDLHLLADILRSKQHNRIVTTTEYIMECVMSQTLKDMDPHVINCV